MLSSLDHLAVAVRDLDQAEASYRRLLGRRASWRGRHPGLGTANALFRLDNTTLELLARDGDGPIGEALDDWIARRGEGVWLLAFGVADASAAARWLEGRGFDVAGPVDGEGIEDRSGARRRWRSVLLPRDGARGVQLLAIERLAASAPLPLAPVEGAGHAAAVAACDHVVVTSAAAEATKALYAERLGIRLALDRAFPVWGLRLLFFRLGGVTLEIAAPLGAPVASDDVLWGVSWRTPDVAAARERLFAAGIDVSEVRPGRRAATRVATVRSPPHGVATPLLGPDPAGG